MGEGQSCDTDQDLDLGAWTGPPGRTYKYILSKYAKAKYEKYRFGHRQGFRSGGISTVKQGNYSLRRPPKLIIPQAVIEQ